MSFPSILFSIAALINTVSLVGRNLHPDPDAGKRKVYTAKQLSERNCWHYLTASLAVAALLYIKWARTPGGPQTLEEQAILFVLLVGGFFVGLRYFKSGEYPPIGCLVVSPSLAMVGFLSS